MVAIAQKLTRSVPQSVLTCLTVVCGSLYLALMSQIALKLPLLPVHMSLQTFAVFTLAGTLGSRKAFASVALYLAEGTCGLPVFAGGVASPMWFFMPKGGFLVGFALAAFAVGKLLEIRKPWTVPHIAFSVVCGQLIIYACGMTWLSFFVGVDMAFLVGVYPFLSGAFVKLIAATSYLKGLSWFHR